jgi:hypothetical protein
MKAAAERVGKSPSSVRRIVYPIIESDQHPDRDQIQPSAEDALAMRMRGENFAWRINEDFLMSVARIETPTEHDAKVSPPRPHPSSAEGELLSMLRRELEIKNEQIKQQSELISKQVELVSGLSERLREGNILIGSLQQRLSLPDGRVVHDASSTRSNIAPTKPEKGSRGNTKSSKPTANVITRLLRKKLW